MKVSKSPWNILCLIKNGILNLKKNLHTKVKLFLIKSSIFFGSILSPNHSWVAKYFEQDAKKIDIGLNAGHDLSQENLKYFNDSIKNLLEVSIGHALICESIYNGLEKTIKSYLDILNNENSSF